jgi:Co/Zn/Cd efflux system component
VSHRSIRNLGLPYLRPGKGAPWPALEQHHRRLRRTRSHFGIAIVKFIATFFTGSSAIFSEGIHSRVDTGNQGLILVGIRRGRRQADAEHPSGYGKELYF